ncbi:MAG: MaoC family dehydratase [Thermoleophilia bacterium]
MGDAHANSLTRQITQAGIDAYAEVAGDFNPIHVDAEYAQGTPFGGTIAHGFYIFSFGSVLLRQHFGNRWVKGGSIEAKFRRAARPGDMITVTALPQGMISRGGRQCLALTMIWENQNGDTVIEGEAYVPEAPGEQPVEQADEAE